MVLHDRLSTAELQQGLFTPWRSMGYLLTMAAITRERLLGLHLHHDRRLLLATARRLLAAVLHRLMLRLASWCVLLDLGMLGYTVTQRPVLATGSLQETISLSVPRSI